MKLSIYLVKFAVGCVVAAFLFVAAAPVLLAVACVGAAICALGGEVHEDLRD